MQTITRLYDTFHPENYQLTLNLEREKRIFSGTVTIQGKLVSKSSEITLHSKQLSITSALINGEKVTVTEGENDELLLSKGSSFNEGDYSLELAFSGTITDSMHGLYPCYFNHNDKKKELLATQFESHHAREVFPCIDEPEAKATFDLTLCTETGVTVLSNMPVLKENKKDNQLVTTFQRSPRMSTYLLAFVVGEVHYVEAKTNTGVDVRVYSAPTQQKESLKFALETAVRTIDFFDDYFGIPYPLPKADHIALPDMGGGGTAAMENWGLITYREDYLVADDSVGISTKQRIARVIVHETSHQWFGNLVTMKWWDDLWLNESFASLMEFVGLEALFPEWHHWDDFVSSETLPSLRRDSNPGVQSIKTDVNHPDEIGTLFDGAIVYAKGAAVLRMLLEYIGEEKFQKGLQRYFQKHAYHNTTGNDLWESLDPSATAFISPWLVKSGFPVVNITRKNDETYMLHQSEFLIGAEPDKSKTWPLLLAANATDSPGLMTEKELEIVSKDPLQLNVDGKSQYIVNYDKTSRKQLLERIEKQNLDVVDRMRLLLETTLLMRTPHLASATLIDLLAAYSQESSQPVWDMLAFSFGTLKIFVEDDDQAEQGLKKLARQLTQNELDRLGWQKQSNEKESDTKLRATILGLSLYGEAPEVVSKALEIYSNNKDDITKIDGEIRSIILASAVRHGDTSEVVDHLLAVHDSTNSSELQEDIISGLASTKDIGVIKQLLNIMTDSSRVRPQNAVHWFIYCLRNRYGRNYTWQWVQDNWKWVQDTYGSDKSYDIFPTALGSILSTKEQLIDYKRFFNPLLDDPSLTRTITIGQSEIKARIEWLASDKPAVIKALHNL